MRFMCEKILKKKRKAYRHEVAFTGNELVSQIEKFQLQYDLTEVVPVIGSRLSYKKNVPLVRKQDNENCDDRLGIPTL